MVTASTTEKKVKLNKFEKYKAEKDGLAVKDELQKFAEMGWEAVDETDLTQRLKWLGIFFRPVTPGKFMLRLRMPHGLISAQQMRVLAEIVQRYGDDGSADITTRQNLQLRGVHLEDIPDIFSKMHAVGLTSMQSGMDNVRNITGSPVAGIDANELIDTRELVQAVQDMITNSGQGNYDFTNLPRKFNIALEGSTDNSVHAEINDIAFVPAYKDGNLGFNVLVGGFFSSTRCAAAIPLDVWVPADKEDVVELCRAILTVYRDNGSRGNRQKTRLMWLIDEWGMDKFRTEVEKSVGKPLATAAPEDALDADKRDHVGVFQQKQEGLNYIGLHIPVGRLRAEQMLDLARVAEVYGSGDLRLTVEQNVIIANVPDNRLAVFLAEPIVQTFPIQPSSLVRSLVSCTGAQFCNFALVETKMQSLALARRLDSELDISEPVRIHWTGCPNSCGQPQVAQIGMMGTKARKNGKMVPAVDIYMGGTVGKDAHLGERVMQKVPCDELPGVVRKLLTENFGATLKPGVVIDEPVEETETATPVKTKKPAVVVFSQSDKEINCDDGQPILAIAEAAGIDVESSCQSGSCGTCKLPLIEGKIRYEGDPAALEAGEKGAVLTCIAHAEGRVVIDA
ncbi:ferredoxin--nitrite reductase [Leptothoe sp. LEGE 181152]|uniref:Ferredoxin--nitrite reductase n=1 Tax=Adonisia turfae CCMR0081 TaxID=2292702 RepID=A0A6M0RKW1_9CYAN|nr:ferredoxin--nitrite reductase [Leptothoe sp. LEGE 181152]NEZ56301.1 ferredoxin--nitrite reductase [Adonisia turfae CCMR0081]